MCSDRDVGAKTAGRVACTAEWWVAGGGLPAVEAVVCHSALACPTAGSPPSARREPGAQCAATPTNGARSEAIVNTPVV